MGSLVGIGNDARFELVASLDVVYELPSVFMSMLPTSRLGEQCVVLRAG